MSSIKRGEYGTVLYNENQRLDRPRIIPSDEHASTQPVPATPSPVDSWATSLLPPSMTRESDRQAVIAGSVIASFTVEGLGLDRLANLTNEEITDRFFEFEDLTTFDTAIRLALRETAN